MNTEKKRKLDDGIPVSSEFLNDVLITAIEGGVNYWAEIEDYETLTCGDCNLTIATAKLREHEAEDDAGWYTINDDTIVTGYRRMTHPEAIVNSQLRDEVTAAVKEDDAGQLDIEHADVLVQFAVFSQIVYG